LYQIHLTSMRNVHGKVCSILFNPLFLEANIIFKRAVIKYNYNLDPGLVEAFFEILVSAQVGHNLILYWLGRMERNGIKPSLKTLASVIHRFVYTYEIRSSLEIVEQAKLLDPENYKDVIFSSMLRFVIIQILYYLEHYLQGKTGREQTISCSIGSGV
jgi:hypothetical protein